MTIFLQRNIIHHATILVTLITLVISCSSTRLIYTFVDKFIEEEVAYFLNLDVEEEILLRRQVQEMVEWHRTSMLPRYAVYLNDIADQLEADKNNSANITRILLYGKFLVEETVTGLTPYASKFLIRYQTTEAIELMKERMLMRQQERLLELSKPEDILYENRLKRLTLNFERFFGDLTNAQISLLEIHARETLSDSRTRLHNRTLRQKVFIRYLRTYPNEAELTAYINKLLLRGYLITNPSYQTFSEDSLNRFTALIVSMLAISSKTQREQIIKKLRIYADDFKVVSK